jgi:ATP-dependent Lon protease
MSAEATVVRGYIDWMVQVPWNARSKVKKDLRQAQEIARIPTITALSA